MKVSIVTVCYNSEKTIRDTIKSVLSQDYKNIEYIIVDGNSMDGTMGIIEEYKARISMVICEADDGIYDAMNKGISMCTGQIICLLNSDDIYSDKSVISNIVRVFNKNDADCVFGDIYYVASDDLTKIIRKWKTGEYYGMKNGWHAPNPAFFVKRNVYEQYGLFDISFDISADFEFMLRVVEKYKVKITYYSQYVVMMRVGGESNRSIKNIIKGNKNIIKAFNKNGIAISPFYTIKRIIKKIYQFV